LDCPVAYGLPNSPAEEHYFQLEKEALAMVFAVKKFHHYLWGRYFADYQLLKSLLGKKD